MDGLVAPSFGAPGLPGSTFLTAELMLLVPETELVSEAEKQEEKQMSMLDDLSNSHDKCCLKLQGSDC